MSTGVASGCVSRLGSQAANNATKPAAKAKAASGNRIPVTAKTVRFSSGTVPNDNAATMAALQLCLTLHNSKILEHFNDFADEQIKGAGTNYPEVVDGEFQVPEGPCWGIDLNEDFINDHPPPMVSGVVQDPGLQMFEKPDWARRGQQNA